MERDEEQPLGSTTNITKDSRFKCVRKDRSCVRSYGKSRHTSHTVQKSGTSDTTSRQRAKEERVPSPVNPVARANGLSSVSGEKPQVSHETILSEDPITDRQTAAAVQHLDTTDSSTILIEDDQEEQETPLHTPEPNKPPKSSPKPNISIKPLPESNPTKPAPSSVDAQHTNGVQSSSSSKADSTTGKSKKEAAVLVKWFFDIVPPNRVVLLGYKE